MKILVTGGARSGKSSFAERYAAALGKGNQGIYVATAQAYDDEMRQRLELHRAQRLRTNFVWDTVEEPYKLADTLDKLSGCAGHQVVLVDCLTLWLSNWLLRLEQDREAKRQSDSHVQVGAQQEITLSEPINQLLNSIACFKGNLLLVTNEVGDGIVPEYKLGRTFRDWAGMLNQRVAAQCDEVFLVTAGIPVELKKLALRMEGVWPMTEHAGESGSSA